MSRCCGTGTGGGCTACGAGVVSHPRGMGGGPLGPDVGKFGVSVIVATPALLRGPDAAGGPSAPGGAGQRETGPAGAAAADGTNAVSEVTPRLGNSACR